MKGVERAGPASYLEVARALPTPTPEQTLAYARFVTTAHSWHKGLFLRHIVFTFFLDPNAGMVANKDSGWWKGPDYRQRFGHWSYQQTPPFTFHSADHSVLGIPDRLAEAGTAHVDAFIWGPDLFDPPHPDHPAMRPGPLTETERVNWSPLDVPSPDRPASIQFHEALASRLAVLPAGIAAALRPLLVLWNEDSYRQEVARLYETIRAQPFGARDAARERALREWEDTELRRREKPLLKVLADALDRERDRQIAVMIDAMNRFVSALRSTVG
jgi:hypothetical protein